MIELYIEGKRCDTASTEIALTWLSNTLGQLDKLEGNRSTTIQLPRTGNNAAILAVAELPATGGAKARQRLTARLLVDGVEVFADGWAVLLAVTPTAYEIALTWGVASAFNAMAADDVTLREMDWLHFDSGDTVTLVDTPNTLATISQQDWRWLAYKTEVDIGDPDAGVPPYLPSVYVLWLLQQICGHYGITLHLGTDAIDWIRDKVVVLTTADVIADDIVLDCAVEMRPLGTEIYLQPSEDTIYLTHHTEVILPDWYTANYNLRVNVVGALLADDPFKVTGMGDYSEEITATYDADLGKYKVDINWDSINIASGGILQIWLDYNSHLNSISSNGFEVTITDAEPCRVGDDMPLRPNLPDMTAIEFVKEITMRAGVFAYTAWGGDVWFVSVDALQASNPQTLPDPVKVERVEWKFGDYAQANVMTYKTDDGGDNEGKGVLEVADTTLEVEKKLFDSKFGLFYGRNRLHLYKRDDADDPWEYTNAVQRLGVVEPISRVVNDGLAWSELLTSNLQAWAAVLRAPVVVKATIPMHVADVVALDFARSVYIKQLGRKYAIKQISTSGNGMYNFELIQL